MDTDTPGQLMYLGILICASGLILCGASYETAELNGNKSHIGEVAGCFIGLVGVVFFIVGLCAFVIVKIA